MVEGVKYAVVPQDEYDTLKASRDKLLLACQSFMGFANTDLPKGAIHTIPEDWLDELKAKTHQIKQALKEAGEI